jgi:predicted O-linked N-acetylglucosamine transferase (SPINDLY family)
LITESLPDYERRLLELIEHPEQLRQLRTRLAARRHSSPLFNTPRFTRHLEAAYALAHESADTSSAQG